MFNEMKKPLGNISLFIHPEEWQRGLIQAVCHSSVPVSYFFLEMEVTEE
jgi:hypothetical protein